MQDQQQLCLLTRPWKLQLPSMAGTRASSLTPALQQTSMHQGLPKSVSEEGTLFVWLVLTVDLGELHANSFEKALSRLHVHL